tara:strand:+ start:1023 stop:1139 length:117 start_codon:yes stop_codon:yes gene_type:complete
LLLVEVGEVVLLVVEAVLVDFCQALVLPLTQTQFIQLQ